MEKKKNTTPKKPHSKEVIERAKRIQLAKKAEEKKLLADSKKAKDKKEVNEKKETKEEENQLVDFAITARKYKTQLTRKYKNRKFWENPSPFDIFSYIPGTIISIDIKEGKVVEEGTQLLILEAMKMQNRVDMPFTARIKKIHIKVGERIPKDHLLIELEAI